MSKTIIAFCLIIATLFVCAFAAEPDQTQFISDYVAAVNGKDVDGYEIVLLRLRANNKENVLIFRSLKKK